MARNKGLIVHVVAYLLAIAGTLRYIEFFLVHPYRWLIFSLLAVFFLLLTIGSRLSRLSHRYMHLYLVVQMCIPIALTNITTIEDFVALPFLSLILQAMHVLPPRIGFRWISVFVVILVVLMSVYGIAFHGIHLEMILLTAVVYVTIFLLIGAFLTVIHQVEIAHEKAEAARRDSQALLAELHVAHRQLQMRAAQVEELSAEQERSRLARHLHDSVTQTIFSMTLTAEAAKILIDRDLEQVVIQLDKLIELAKSAFVEIRSLIFELHPTAVADHGLMPALQQHFANLESQHNLSVVLQVTGEQDLPERQAERLFYIIQEALNNVIKHAKADEARVDLQFENGHISSRVEDNGQGFDPEAIDSAKKTMGLSSMRERVEMMGGTLIIDSRPGEGTRVNVEVPIAKEDINDN